MKAKFLVLMMVLGLVSVPASASTVAHVYWSDFGPPPQPIRRANLDGSNVEEIAPTNATSLAIDLVSEKLYWTSGGSILRSNFDGTNIETVLSAAWNGASSVLALDTVAGKMYWTDSLDDNIRRANLDGSNVVEVLAGTIHPNGLALDIGGGKMYWSESSGSDKIRRANLDGTDAEDLVTTGLVQPGGVALDLVGSKLYFTDQEGETIERANLDGTGRETILTSVELTFPIHLALDIDGGKMYWTEAFLLATNGRVRRANLDGMNIEDLFIGINPIGLALLLPHVSTLTLDIKPGSDPNSINCNNDQGVIPVAILTTDDFDATSVDHTTVMFEGAEETHVNRRTGDARRHEEDVDGDGDTDLVLHFRLGDTALGCSSTEGTLTGEAFDGTPIELTDSVRMVGGTTVITVGQPVP